MQNLTEILGTLAGIVTGISTSLALFDFFYNKYLQKGKLKLLKNKEFEKIIESSDIKILGNYLDNEIGLMTISDYVDNEEINKKVNTFISRLTRFVGTDEQIRKEEIEETVIEKIEISEQQKFEEFPFRGKLNAEFDKIIDELFWGESWNALARLRRYIEITLREIGAKNKLDLDKTYSITKMIDLLVNRKIIDANAANNLRFTVYVSNKAIHGQDLQKGQAEEAIYHAAMALDLIKNNKSSAPNNL